MMPFLLDVTRIKPTGQHDEIWVLPVYKHMYAEKREAMAEPGAPTFEDRVNMCR